MTRPMSVAYDWFITPQELEAWLLVVYENPFGNVTPTEHDIAWDNSTAAAKEIAEMVAKKGGAMPEDADPDEWAREVIRTTVKYKKYPISTYAEQWRWRMYHLRKYAHRNDEVKTLAAMFIDAPEVEDTNGGDLADALDAWLAAGGDGAE